MNFSKIKEYKKEVSFTVIIIGLLIVIGILVLKNNNYKYDLFYYHQIVPDIELYNGLSIKGGNVTGEVSGFVTFLNKDDQPKDLKQYYIINFKGESASLKEVIKMRGLPPKNIGLTSLEKVRETTEDIEFVDEFNNSFFVVKDSGAIWMIGSDGDKTVLFDSEYSYRDLMTKRIRSK
jgi:hypothetical protein